LAPLITTATRARRRIPVFVVVFRQGFNGGYKYRRIQVTGEERYTDEPVKNGYSHPHDALQYLALKYGGAQAIKGPRRSAGRLAPFRPTVHGTGVLG
jgi:hypothetical protein